jgi:hypothetical protein
MMWSDPEGLFFIKKFMDLELVKEVQDSYLEGM